MYERPNFGDITSPARHRFRPPFTDHRPAITANLALLQQAVAQFDARFTLRVLRSVPSMRKSPHIKEALTKAITALYTSTPDAPSKRFLESALNSADKSVANGHAPPQLQSSPILPESFVYLAVLVQVCHPNLPVPCHPCSCI